MSNRVRPTACCLIFGMLVAACGSGVLSVPAPPGLVWNQRGGPNNLDFDALIRAARRGEKVNCGSIADPTPLDWAVGFDRPDVVRTLLEAGADPNARWSESGDRFPLQEAIESSFGRTLRHRVEIISLLLQHGADPNARWCPFESRGAAAPNLPCESKTGVTPLIAATVLRQSATAVLLLIAGADPTLEDGHGRRASDDTTRRDHPWIAPSPPPPPPPVPISPGAQAPASAPARGSRQGR